MYYVTYYQFPNLILMLYNMYIYKNVSLLIQNSKFSSQQAKVVEDLQKLGASEPIVVSEMKKLQVLQAIASKNFRQDLVQKLRRQKNKASYIKDKFGLGPGSTVSTTTHPPKLDKIGKSKSVALPSPVKEESILGKILRFL